ncbi:MAG: hypothetical protein B7Z66_10535 [Chromatiales bacterium 21-64-14]|nr:MAG: hypothetical protein B7Z66_10535 [Chromatiales bacterium 21-64-14]HQU15764.1 YggT family protein [Gammaproteobacteria bacterium]
MGGPYAANAAVFLIRTLFGFGLLAVLLRFLLAWARADFYNPVSQFLVRVTSPIVVPLRRVIPPLGRVDLASVVLLLALGALEFLLVGLVQGVRMNPVALPVLSLASILDLTLHVYLISILVQVVLSWVNPGTYHPLAALLYSLNKPLLGPARRLLPPIGGLDLSPLVILVGLQLISILLVAPLRDLGWGLAGHA